MEKTSNKTKKYNFVNDYKIKLSKNGTRLNIIFDQDKMISIPAETVLNTIQADKEFSGKVDISGDFKTEGVSPQ